MPGGGGACKVDLKDPSAIMKASFGIDAELEGKVKAAMAAGANLQKIAADIEAELAGACGQLAKDLGAKDADIKPADAGRYDGVARGEVMRRFDSYGVPSARAAQFRVFQGAGHRLRHDPRAIAVLLGWLDRQRVVSGP